MNKALEVLLTVLALAGMYCALPKNNTPSGAAVRAQQEVMIADGSDPMPLCRRHCTCKPEELLIETVSPESR